MWIEKANHVKDKQSSSPVNVPKANLVVASKYSAKETFKHNTKKGHYQGNRKKHNQVCKGGNKIEKKKLSCSAMCYPPAPKPGLLTNRPHPTGLGPTECKVLYLRSSQI